MGRTVCFHCRRSLKQEDEIRLLTRACEQCFVTLLSSRDEKASVYLESLEMPAALLAKDHTVIVSNSQFQDMASQRDVAGLRLGDVLECMYSPLLGRCEETVACLLCSFRRSVEHTWLTGEGLRQVPLSLPHKEEARKTYAITTERVGDAVLLLVGTTIAQPLK